MNELRTYVPKTEEFPENPAYAVRVGMHEIWKEHGPIDFESILMTPEFYEKLIQVFSPGRARVQSMAVELHGSKLMLWGVEFTQLEAPLPHGYAITYRR